VSFWGIAYEYPYIYLAYLEIVKILYLYGRLGYFSICGVAKENPKIKNTAKRQTKILFNIATSLAFIQTISPRHPIVKLT
jgi:hypothetical protein